MCEALAPFTSLSSSSSLKQLVNHQFRREMQSRYLNFLLNIIMNFMNMHSEVSASALGLVAKDKGTKSIDFLGIILVIISNGLRPVLPFTKQLYANSTIGRM